MVTLVAAYLTRVGANRIEGRSKGPRVCALWAFSMAAMHWPMGAHAVGSLPFLGY
jgi:hypothetical protein